MFGKSMFRLVKWAIALGIALVAGAYLMTSIAEVVVILRAGNYTLFAVALVFTGIVVRISGTYEGKWIVARIMLPVLSGVSSIYVIMIIFVWLLPMGIITSLIAAGFTMCILGIIHNPSLVQENLAKAIALPQSMSALSPIGRQDRSKTLLRSVERLGMRVLILPKNSWDKVITLLNDRPQLPVALVHFQDEDVLIVRSNGDHSGYRRTKELLEEIGITKIRDASPLYTRTVLALPILEESRTDGGWLEQYKIITHRNTVKVVLEQRPLEMTVFPSQHGLILLVKSSDVFGLKVEEVPQSQIGHIVLGRDISILQSEGVMGGNANAA